ncbi:ABC transporter ATP-binding protein [Sulfurospirillum arcachonense]|uniref:ABC transporter ATP-binding protein n=1 Tax=Sulfurospirillum arcachonense TaxID=57666 RepID=UPI0004695AA4|nr:ABC transporter ATP-binding protein [Sulfurospirillum arcachonense]
MIRCKNISKIFNVNKPNELTALKEIDLKFKEGELVILKGASGSGKSTLLSLIAALSKPNVGEVIIDEKRISKMPDNFTSLFRRENVGFIFQKYNLIPTLSAYDNIILPLIPTNPNEKQLHKRIDELLKTFCIEDKKDVLVKNLSGGEQQRVAISRALINNPKIIIADEPTANLDAKLSLDFIEIIKSLKNDATTILIATHDPLFFDLDFVDKIVELKNGEVIDVSHS